VRSIIVDHAILMAAKKRKHMGRGQVMGFKAMRMSGRGGEGREKIRLFSESLITFPNLAIMSVTGEDFFVSAFS
jgi:hypothetical protein